MNETRAIVLALLLASFMLTTTSGFIFGFLGANGVAVPASAAYVNGLQAAYINQTLNAQNANTVSSTQSGLSVPSIAAGLIGNFYVFGGLIIATFGYLAAIPTALGGITQVVANPIASQSAVSSIVAIAAVSISALVVAFFTTAIVTPITINRTDATR